jgi:hypothetical protein
MQLKPSDQLFAPEFRELTAVQREVLAEVIRDTHAPRRA